MELKRRVEFDDILDEIGNFGTYQFLLLVFVASKDILASWHNLFFIFSNADPGWRCANVSSNFSDAFDGTCDTECDSIVFDSKYTSIVTEWNLICDYAYIPQLTVTIQFLGVLVGAAIYGQLADVYGRKWTFLSSVVAAMISQVLVGTSGSVVWFTVWRGINGIALGGSMGISYVYTAEFVGPKWRPVLFGAGFWDYGTCLFALLAWGVPDWRNLSYITGAGNIILIPMVIWMVPESPRWLIQTGQEERAEHAIKFIAKINGREMPEKEMLRALFDTVGAQANLKRYSYLDLFTTSRSMAKYTVVLILIWFTMAEIYYAINAAVPSFSGDIYWNVVYSALSMIPVLTLSVLLFRRYRRKVCFVAYSLITAASLFSVAALELLHVRQPMLILSLALVGKSVGGSLWLLTGMITLEIYPTLMRTIGFGAGNAICRVGASIAPQILLLGLLYDASIPYVVHGVLIILSTAACLMFLPETLNQPLPEMNDIMGQLVTNELAGDEGSGDEDCEL